MKRNDLSGRRQEWFVAADVADGADDRATADGGDSGALVKKASEKSGPELKTARRNPADEMNRSIKSLDAMKASPPGIAN